MRIFSVGDLHNDRSLAAKLAEKAERERADLVIICGDLTHADVEPKGLIGPFLQRKRKVLFVPGNHESMATHDFLKALYPTMTSLHGYSVRYEHVGIFGCGKANIGAERLSERELHETLKRAHTDVANAEKRIMVTHVHPDGTLMSRLSVFVPGSSGVRKAIEELQPDIAFCSHVHEAEGIEERIGKTRVINVGPKGFFLDI